MERSTAPVLRKLRRCVLLAGGDGTERHDKAEEHGEKNGDALLPVAEAAPERKAERRRNQQNGDHFKKICESVWIFQRMRRVDAQISTAVRAGLLDCDLACGGPHGDELFRDDLGALNRLSVFGDGACRRVDFCAFYQAAVGTDSHRFHKRNRFGGFHVLNHASADKAERQDQIQGQKNIQDGPCQIHPEAAEPRGPDFPEAADEGKQDRDSGSGRDKVLDREAEGLCQVAERRFAAVGLPVGVCYKAYGRVKRQIPRNARQLLRIAAEDALQQLQKEQKQKSDAGKNQNGRRVFFPRHLLVGIDPHDFVDRFFAWNQSFGEKRLFPVHDLPDVCAERHGKQYQNGKIQRIL
jgi:hypothetical protein